MISILFSILSILVGIACGLFAESPKSFVVGIWCGIILGIAAIALEERKK